MERPINIPLFVKNFTWRFIGSFLINILINGFPAVLLLLRKLSFSIIYYGFLLLIIIANYLILSFLAQK